jgi:hypothetical protein
MTEQHPIIPPQELVQQWADMIATCTDTEVFSAATQWGSDQELEACCEWLSGCGCESYGRELRAARRPKPQSLNSIALQMLGTIERDAHYIPEITDTIRRALEALND